MRSKHPLLEYIFPLCNYGTKVKYNYSKHVKIHSDEYQKRRKLEEVQIEKLLITNKIDYTREHTVSYSCVDDNENQNSRIDFVIEHTNVINKEFGRTFLKVHDHAKYLECPKPLHV